MKNNNGITLIALVITIIVLLILASVSISTLLGQNGILTKATYAKEEARGGSVEDAKNLWLLENNLIDRTDGTKKTFPEIVDMLFKQDLLTEKNKDDLLNEIENPDRLVEIGSRSGAKAISFKETETETETEITLTLKEEILTSEIPKVEGSVSKVKDTTVPIPTGFYYVGGTANTGVIISDNAIDENKGETSTTINGNQFVWVATRERARIKLIITYPTGVTVTTKWLEGKITDVETIASTGTTFIGDTIDVKNGTYTVYVKASNGEETISTITITKNQFARKDWSSGASFASSLDDETDQVYQKLIASVKKYGGFYIARYEASYGAGAKPLSKVSASSSITVFPSVAGLWNYIDQPTAIEKSRAMYSENTSVVSCLPYGITWDSILQWLLNTENKSKSQIETNSYEWGNYTNDTFSETTGLGNTGAWIDTKANNIYDLAGNLWEWTQEKYDVNRIRRGSGYNYTGSERPVVHRTSTTSTSTSGNIGFRPQLFLN